jgi:hypothetical protein
MKRSSTLPILAAAGLFAVGCAQSTPATKAPAKTTAPKAAAASSEQGHAPGPNGGVVFDLGSHHAEFTVDHDAKQFKVLVLSADEKGPGPVAAAELLLRTKETNTADGKVVPPMTVVLQPVDPADGKAAEFVGTDPGAANVADFAGSVSGEIDGKPAMGEFAEGGGDHDHGHAHSPHDGVVAALRNSAGAGVGFVELKLHDDKGDLELWLAKDDGITQPLDLPVGSEVTAKFSEAEGKTAVLRARNKVQNEDEEGTPNLRDGMTNYFIFPGESGQDPRWLMGADFQSSVQLTAEVDGETYTSEEFVLVPHTHAGGHAH